VQLELARQNAALFIVLAAIVLAACASKPAAVTVSFWAGDGDPPSEVYVHPDHPCGSTITLSVRTVPTDLDWIEHERMFELDTTGIVRRSWPVPIDRYPLGVIGNELILSYGSSPTNALRVTPEGELTVSETPALPPLEPVPCPDAFRDFGDSAYAHCVKQPDRPESILAYEGPCT
jgi:hypothetical protein